MNIFDVVIPCHPKDSDNLSQCLKSLRNLSNVGKIYVVSPIKIDLDVPCEYTHVSDRLFDHLFTIDLIKQRWQNEFPEFARRSSWIYQQLIKLFCYKVINLTESFIFLDSDTMILKDLKLDTNKFQYCIPQENHIEYKKSYKYMTGLEAVDFSFIAHFMMFKTDYLNEIVNHVEDLHKKPFFDVMLDSLNYQNMSPFAEQELYGNWVYAKHNEICESIQLKAKDLDHIPNDDQIRVLSMDFDLVSSHAWIRGIE